jgi:hypothetical protein
LRKTQQQRVDWRTFATLAVQGHELELFGAAGVTGKEADEQAYSVARAVIQEIGGIDRFAELMARLTREAPANAQLDDKLFEMSGYNAARARLFPGS